MRFTRPLAIMPSADQVPIESPHSTMLGGNWVVLIAGSAGSALRAVRPPNLHIAPVIRRDLVYAASTTAVLVPLVAHKAPRPLSLHDAERSNAAISAGRSAYPAPGTITSLLIRY